MTRRQLLITWAVSTTVGCAVSMALYALLSILFPARECPPPGLVECISGPEAQLSDDDAWRLDPHTGIYSDGELVHVAYRGRDVLAVPRAQVCGDSNGVRAVAPWWPLPIVGAPAPEAEGRMPWRSQHDL